VTANPPSVAGGSRSVTATLPGLRATAQLFKARDEVTVHGVHVGPFAISEGVS